MRWVNKLLVVTAFAACSSLFSLAHAQNRQQDNVNGQLNNVSGQQNNVDGKQANVDGQNEDQPVVGTEFTANSTPVSIESVYLERLKGNVDLILELSKTNQLSKCEEPSKEEPSKVSNSEQQSKPEPASSTDPVCKVLKLVEEDVKKLLNSRTNETAEINKITSDLEYKAKQIDKEIGSFSNKLIQDFSNIDQVVKSQKESILSTNEVKNMSLIKNMLSFSLAICFVEFFLNGFLAWVRRNDKLVDEAAVKAAKTLQDELKKLVSEVEALKAKAASTNGTSSGKVAAAQAMASGVTNAAARTTQAAKNIIELTFGGYSFKATMYGPALLVITLMFYIVTLSPFK